MQKIALTFAVAAIASLSLSNPASATLSAGTILADFNAVIYGNATTPSDVEGAIVVGGDASAATIYNNPTSGTLAGFGALTVYGNTSGNSINIDNGGSAYVAGTKGAPVNFNGGGSYIAAPSYSITDFQTPLNGLSQSLSLLAATSYLPATGNNEVISATPGSDGIAVYNITAAQLSAIPSFQIMLNGASTVVFNVSGNATYNANDESGTTGANNIIWNFYDATSVAINTQIGGTVLAPHANVSNGNQIDGALVAASWTGSGELHDYAFNGTLPSTNVPEPATLAILGVGCLGVVVAHRRSLARS